VAEVLRVLAAAAIAAGTIGAGACSAPVSRRDVVDGYRRELVRQGVGETEARCVTDRFFAELTDGQLRAFQGRDELTDDERETFARLGVECDPSP
jgi:hypothetical protein